MSDDEEDRRIILRRRALLLAGVVSGLGLVIAAPDAGSTPCPVHGLDEDDARGAARTRRGSPDAAAATPDASAPDASPPRPELEGGFDPRGIAGPPAPTVELPVRAPERDELITCLSPYPCLSPPPPPPAQGCTCGRRRVPELS